jgi:ABC-type Fe3+ transport system permease subunit
MAILSWQLTDEQYIARVRWFHRWRRILAIGFLAIVLTYLTLQGWLSWSMWNSVWKPLPTQREEQSTSEAERRGEADHDECISADEALETALIFERFGQLRGFSLGLVIGGTTIFTLLGVNLALAMLIFRDRKTELLLRCLDDGPEAVGESRDERSGA